MKQNPDFISVKNISLADNNLIRTLFGEYDKNLKLIEKLEPVKIVVRGNSLSVTGELIPAELVENLIIQLYALLEKGYPIYPADIDYAHRILSSNSSFGRISRMTHRG